MDVPSQDPPTPPAAAASSHGLSRLLGRNLQALAVSQAVGKVAGFVAMVVLARFLGTVDFGRFTAAIALVSLLAVVTEFGTTQYLIREGAQRPEAMGETLGRVLVLRLGLSVATVAAAVPLALVLGFDRVTVTALLLFAVASGLRLLAGAYVVALQALERMRDVAAIQAQQSMVQAAAMMAAVALTRDLIAVAWSMVVVGMVYPPYARARLRRRWAGRVRVRAAGLLSTFRVTTAFAVSSAMFVLLTYLDSVMIQAFRGNAETGLYGAAYRLLLSLSLVPTIYNESITRSLAYLAATDRARMSALYGRSIVHLLMLALPVAVGGALVSGPLMATVFGGQYAGAGTALAILLASLVLVFPGYVNTTAAYALGLERRVAVVLPFVVLINAGANLVLIPAIGIEGAALATLGSEVLFIGALSMLLG
ncbi:MAG: flippase, partial [Actinomycetota bacterium]|nr:flippase [Actinomycetota bacterium]